MQMSDSAIQARLHGARVARLATVDAAGRPHLVPVCFAYDGQTFYSAVDGKPKHGGPLARVRNIEANPEIALLVDEYSEDWDRLWYIMIRGRAAILREGEEHAKALGLLRQKYAQYLSAQLLPPDAVVIGIRPDKIIPWGS